MIACGGRGIGMKLGTGDKGHYIHKAREGTRDDNDNVLWPKNRPLNRTQLSVPEDLPITRAKKASDLGIKWWLQQQGQVGWGQRGGLRSDPAVFPRTVTLRIPLRVCENRKAAEVFILLPWDSLSDFIQERRTGNESAERRWNTYPGSEGSRAKRPEKGTQVESTGRAIKLYGI